MRNAIEMDIIALPVKKPRTAKNIRY